MKNKLDRLVDEWLNDKDDYLKLRRLNKEYSRDLINYILKDIISDLKQELCIGPWDSQDIL